MKIVLTKVPQGSQFKMGAELDMKATELETLTDAGHEYVTASEHAANETLRKHSERVAAAREKAVDNAITKAVEKGIFLPKEDTGPVKAKALKMEEMEDGFGVNHILDMPVKAKQLAVARQTSGSETEREQFATGEASFRETIKEYVSASEPFAKTMKKGGIISAMGRGTDAEIAKGMENATALSRVKSSIVHRISNLIKAGADYKWDEVFKGADYVDPGASNPLGTLNTDLLLNFNFGNLENQLAMLDDITTDISDQPVKFNQTALTRYLQVPGFQTKASGTAWAPATGASVDVNVKMDQYIGVPLAWNENYLGATTRSLPQEFRTPQLYGLAQAIIYKLINNIINGNTRIANDGVTTSTIKPNAKPDGVTAGKPFNIANPTLATFVSALPSAMDLAQFPGGDEDELEEVLRWAWVHTTVYASATQDSNLILNQTLQRLGKTINPNTMVTGKINRLGNISFRKSQLFNDQNSLAADPNNAASQIVQTGNYLNATTLGAAGTRSGLLFTSRLPLDYTKQLDVTGGYAIEVYTTPKLGIKFAIVKFLDHAYETANMRASLMFGTALGDERQIMLLNVK